MAIWASTNFTGGAVDTGATATTEPVFQSKSGTINYRASFGGAGQSIEPLPSGTGQFQLDLSGKSRVRVAFDVKRVTGTLGAGLQLIVFRDGSTARGDCFLRQTTGGKIALRGTTAGATNYSGESARAFVNGEVYHLEMEWESGVGFKLYQWYPGNASATPDETYTSAMTSPVTNVSFGNPTSATVAATFQFAEFRATNGEQYRTSSTPAPGTFVYNLAGLATSTSIRAVAKATSATALRLVASLSPDFSSPIYSSSTAPDADGYTKLSISGLTPNTLYYWATEVDGIRNTSATGKARTLPTPGSKASFTFWSGSCHDSVGSSVFDLIRARDPLFGVQVGDMGYPYITGGLGTGANSNVAPSDAALIRTHRELTITAAKPNQLYREVPFSYTYSDCDGPGGNGDGTWPAIVSGDVQKAYRQQFAHPDLPLSDCGARSWVVGRVRFVHTDELTLSSSRDATDNSAKSKLGATQKAWFKAELLAAQAAGQVVFWIGDGEWYGPATTGTDNSWGRYLTERAELGAFIRTNHIRLVRIHGDTHSLFADDGSHNSAGRFPEISAAPMHTTANYWGVTTSHGSYPTGSTPSSRQYGYYEVKDSGDTLTLIFHGFSSTVSAPTEVERVTMTVTWKMFGGLRLGSVPAVAMYAGDKLVWSA